LFERCREEQRTLVTTSTRLMRRRDCPTSAYCINPVYLPHLEVAFLHMLLTHGVVLEPSRFLTRCVVCNGNILPVADAAHAKAVLEGYQAPESLLYETIPSDEGNNDENTGDETTSTPSSPPRKALNVFQCNGCGQGYWWCDRPTSSASRVKTAATRLFELCIRAGVPYQGSLEIFQHLPVQELQRQGWDWSQPGSALLRQRLRVLEWLKSEHLACPVPLQSAYAVTKRPSEHGKDDSRDDGDTGAVGELLPFTNVTDDFVNTLDYILYNPQQFSLTHRLYVPTTFAELNPLNYSKGHLLPSHLWPSDHLAIGARLTLLSQSSPMPISVESKVTDASEPISTLPNTAAMDTYCVETTTTTKFKDGVNAMVASAATMPHGNLCTCGCIPQIPSLFQMAELRRQAKEKAQSSDG